MEVNVYDTQFYEENRAVQSASAHRIVAAIQEFIKPDSVVDVGCGSGGMLAEWLRYGVKDVLGIDGDYVDRDLLMIPEDNFLSYDLTLPYPIKRRYDLATSFEVAEHLDQQYAVQFVELLCNLSDVVVFSAAIPGQGGTHHVNEQWQSYWGEIFAQNGYIASTYIRKRIWACDEVECFYRQNIVTYVKKEKIVHYPLLEKDLADSLSLLNVVAPYLYEKKANIAMAMQNEAYAKRQFDLLHSFSKGRELVVYGAGFNGVNFDYFCDIYNEFPNRIFVDAYKEKTPRGRIPITALNKIKNRSDEFFIGISLLKRNIEVEETLRNLGYDQSSFMYIF